MVSLDEAIYEVGDRTRNVRIEAEQVRLARLAASSRSGDGVAAMRRTVLLVGDQASLRPDIPLGKQTAPPLGHPFSDDITPRAVEHPT